MKYTTEINQNSVDLTLMIDFLCRVQLREGLTDNERSASGRHEGEVFFARMVFVI